ncbi:MAG: sulfite exporter TauE/SafE family protein [Salaquimonas sp.]
MFELFTPATIALIGFLALLTATIHGATGVAGGFLLSAAIAPIIGVAPVVPVISIALLISHSSRALFNIRDFDRGAFLAITLPAIPCIIAMAFVYGKMSSQLIALVLGLVILISIPIRRWAKSRKMKATKKTLVGIGTIYGGLSGISLGPGMLLVPFMLGYGLTKEAFVGTLAAIAVVTNVTRLSIYGATDLLTWEYVQLGLLIGLITIPGNWLGRSVLRRMTNENHSGFVDVLTVLGALNFFWLAFR